VDAARRQVDVKPAEGEDLSGAKASERADGVGEFSGAGSRRKMRRTSASRSMKGVVFGS
jgi:hypothetical protein